MKNGNWKVIATVGTFIIVIVGVAVAYGVLTSDVEHAVEDVKAVEAEIEAIEPKVEKNTARIDVVDRDIYYIQQDVEEIKTGIGNILDKMDEQ